MDEWRDHFRKMFADRGYELLAAGYDPLIGWTILYRPTAGGKEVEFEVRTSIQVERRIRALPGVGGEAEFSRG